MKEQPILLWGILSLLVIAIFTLGGVAWTLAIEPAQEGSRADLAAAVESAQADEMTRQASPPPATPLGLTPESLRPSPTSLAEFQVLAPTLTSRPVLSTIYGDPALVLGDATWVNSFESGPGSVNQVESCALVQVVDSSFRVGGEGSDTVYCTLLVQPESHDYYVEISSEVIGACSDGQFGLYIRGTTEGEGAYFGLNCAGDYNLTYEYSDRGGVIVADSSSQWVNAGAGQINRLGVLAIGNRLTLYANGALLAETHDPAFIDGQFFGLFIRTPGRNPVTVEFDDLQFWDLTGR